MSVTADLSGLRAVEKMRGDILEEATMRAEFEMRRYVPMDEALTFTALDFSNRPYLVFDASMPQERIGEYDSCLTVEFMRALAMNAGITLHQKCFYGANAHHITEGLFKSLGMAVRDAVKVEGSGVVSTKGVL